MSTIDIVNAADASYVPHTAAMLHSLFTANPAETFAVHFLHNEDLEAGSLRQLGDLCARHHARFSATAIPRARLQGLPIAGRFPEQAWYRVFLPQVLPGVDRAIWLDSDAIVLAPIRELWALDLEGLPLAATPNAVLYSFAEVVRGIGVEDRRRYFNSGVMLLNLGQMREEGSENTLRAAAMRHRRWIRFADQDVLNAVYHTRYKRLPLAWNMVAHAHINVPETVRVHGHDEYREALAAPKIVHFTGVAAMKPWSYRCSHPHRDAYLRHRAEAGWPPPRYTDRSLRNALVRRLPMRLRAVLRTLWRGKYGEMLSYLREW